MLLGAMPLQSLEALGDQLVFNAEWIVSRTSPVSLSIAELKNICCLLIPGLLHFVLYCVGSSKVPVAVYNICSIYHRGGTSISRARALTSLKYSNHHRDFETLCCQSKALQELFEVLCQ